MSSSHIQHPFVGQALPARHEFSFDAKDYGGHTLLQKLVCLIDDQRSSGCPLLLVRQYVHRVLYHRMSRETPSVSDHEVEKRYNNLYHVNGSY